MGLLLRRAGAAILASAPLAFPVATAPQGSDAPAPRPAASPSPRPSPPPAHTLAASIDHVVERMEQARRVPCRPNTETGVPCFPTSVEARVPEYSVADAVRHMGSDNAPAPYGPPTVSEMAPRPWGAVNPVANLIRTDPVCDVKSIFKKIRGKSDVYYLYRIWDRLGQRAVLREDPLDPAAFQGIPDFRFELLGKFEGECDAVAAYRRALRHAESESTPSPPPAAPR